MEINVTYNLRGIYFWRPCFVNYMYNCIEPFKNVIVNIGTHMSTAYNFILNLGFFGYLSEIPVYGGEGGLLQWVPNQPVVQLHQAVAGSKNLTIYRILVHHPHIYNRLLQVARTLYYTKYW